MDAHAGQVERQTRDPGRAGRQRTESAIPPKQKIEGNGHAYFADFQSYLAGSLFRPFKSLFDPFMRRQHELE